MIRELRSSGSTADGSPRPAVIPVGDSHGARLQLEGLLQDSQRDRGLAVMAPPHPLYGGELSNPVVSEIAAACERAGLGSLRFNWRGVGTSTGAPTGAPEAGREDYGAALAFAEQSSAGPIAACGYSFGAASAVSAAAGHGRVSLLLLVAPPVVMLDREALSSFSGRILFVAGDRDEYAPLRELEVLSEELGSAVLVPLLGTDHYFSTGLRELGRAAESFLEQVAEIL